MSRVIRPQDHKSKTAIVFSHPVGAGAFLPKMTGLAKAGHHVVYINTRYRDNDTALIMEKCGVDLGAGIRDLEKRFGYEREDEELGFTVHGTVADPRWLDPTVDQNGRPPGTCYLGDPRLVNNGPVGLARFCTLHRDLLTLASRLRPR